jgi:outer membrane protein assembly factor BamA
MIKLARVAVGFLTFVSLAAAQNPAPPRKNVPANSGRLIALKVTGTTRYTDKEILAASGLQIGQNAADGDFREAAQRLGDSGLFSDVVYTYSSSGSGVKLELQLADTDQTKLVPARFENFVWFTDDELLTALQKTVPLFKRRIPLTGKLPDRVSEALQAILNERRCPGRVDYLREGEDENGGPLVAIAYRVENVNLRIRGFEFPGASPEDSVLLAAAGRRAIGGSYARSSMAAVATLDLLPVYLQRGYLKAAFGPSDARVEPQASKLPDEPTSAEVEVYAILPVTPGKVYATSGVEWKGNAVIGTSALAPLLHLPTGQPANAVRLLDDLKAVAKLYRSRGYMASQLKPDAKIDDETSTVHYDLNVIEGDLYKMGELEILGLDTQAKARMQEAWTLLQGQPYNADYLRKFLAETGQLLPRGVQWSVSTHETPDSKDKTVDVEIRFKQQ